MVEEANYRELVENASDIIYAHDLEGRFTWVNKACERVTGYSREEAVRMKIWDVLAPEYVEQVQSAVERKLSSEMQLFEVEIIQENPRIQGGHRVEAACDTARRRFRAHGSGQDVESALDQVVSRLERQIASYRAKLKDRRTR